MNKGEFVKAVAEAAGATQKEAGKIIDAALEELTKVLASGDKVSFPGFGTFEVRERAARAGVNPRTKEPVQIAASKAPAFKPGKLLRDAVNP